MIPKLFSGTEYNFTSNGLGRLADAISCDVMEALNGEFELEMQYPASGVLYDQIQQRSIIVAKPDDVRDEQPFRVYLISRPIDGVVTVYARHLSYDLSGAVIKPYSAASAASAVSGIPIHAIGLSPFTVQTNISQAGNFNVSVPTSLRSVIGGKEGSLLDVFGGELEWDKTTVKLLANRGTDRGVSIRYGKNLIDLTQEENCANCYTAVFPFWANNETVIAPTEPVNVSGTFNYTKILTLDLSQDFENEPSIAELTTAAENYITKNKVGVPTVSLSVEFAQLEKTEEYKDNPWLERVQLADTVSVVFSNLGINAKAKVVKVVYDVLLGHYKSVEIGDAKQTIANTLAQQAIDIQEAPKKAASFLETAIAIATRLITGNSGGHVVLHTDELTGKPYELLIMDTESIATATKVWRFNLGGLGYSGTGYNGPYTTAINMNGQIVADFIKAGLLMGIEFKTEALESEAGTTQLWKGIDIDDGKISFYWYKKVNGVITESGTFGDIAMAVDGDAYALNILTHGVGADVFVNSGDSVYIDAGKNTLNGTINIGNGNPTAENAVSNVNLGGTGVLKIFARASRTSQNYSAGSSGQILHSGGANGSAYWQNERTFPYLGTIVVGNPSGDSSYATAFVPKTLWGSGMRFELGSGNSYTQFYVDANGVANKASGSPGNLYGYYIVSADGVEV